MSALTSTKVTEVTVERGTYRIEHPRSYFLNGHLITKSQAFRLLDIGHFADEDLSPRWRKD